MESSLYLFDTVSIHNRLDMEIEIDLCSLYIEDELILVIRANERYHRSTVEKNIEHMAFQLKQRYSSETEKLTIIEYVDRRAKVGEPAKWRQWRFKWVGSSPMNASNHVPNRQLLNNIHHAMLNKQDILQHAS